MAFAVTANKIYDIVPSRSAQEQEHDVGPTTVHPTQLSSIERALNTVQKIIFTSDSGATTHVATGAGLLAKMTNKLQVNETIGGVMSNNSAKITHRGDLEYMVKDNEGVMTPVTIYNVAYVPDAQHLLFSNTQYLDDFWRTNGTEAQIAYDRHECTFTLPDGKSFTGKRHGNLYDVPFHPCDYVDVALSSETPISTTPKSPPKRSQRTRRRHNREARDEHHNKTAAEEGASK
jgi:hypothetical protein